MRTLWILSIVVLLCATAPFAPSAAARVDTADTKMLTQPAISASSIAFIYAGDLFVANTDGSNVRRLTTDDGTESNPVFSPDGKTIAFSAQYDGNTDVYTVPLTGGAPVRLTWHPGADVVQSFTPDGKAILFTSQRATFTGRYLQWKNYRGGTAQRLWLYNTNGHGIEKIPQPAERSNDTDPMWIGDAVFFRSDRAGEFNIFAYDGKTRRVRQVTSHTDFPVLTMLPPAADALSTNR